MNATGPNQAILEASIRKNLKKSEKIIKDKQKMTVKPIKVKTNCNSLLINSMNDNNLTRFRFSKFKT